MHRPQLGQTVLEGFDAPLDFGKVHILCHSKAIGFCQEKNAFSTKNYSGSIGLLPGLFPLFLLPRRRQAVALPALPLAQIDPLQQYRRKRPVNPFQSFPRESHGLYSVTAAHDMDYGILMRGDDVIRG